MSQHRAKSGKTANPLQKPWTKTDKTANAKSNRKEVHLLALSIEVEKS